MATKREYLHGLGLTAAPTGRGRFSREGLAALDKARAEGMTFSDDGDATPTPKPLVVDHDHKVVAPVRTPKSVVASSDYDPKAVRAWAKENGKDIGARGRIDSDLVREYLASVDNAPKRAETDPINNFGPTPGRRFNVKDTFSGEAPEGKITRTYKDACNGCGNSIGWCRCVSGPVAIARDTVTIVSLS